MCTSVAARIKFATLCNVLEEVRKVQAAKKAEVLETFIRKYRTIANDVKARHPEADVSLFPVLRLILPHLERVRGPHNLKATSLERLYVRVFCLGKESKNAQSLKHKGLVSNNCGQTDFAERAYQVLRSGLSRNPSGLSLEQINMFLDDISNADQTVQQKDETFTSLLRRVNAIEFKWITRIVLKDLRLGINTKKILQVVHPDANALFDVKSDLRHVCEKLHNPRERFHHDIQVFCHFKPMLLERCKIEDTKKLFQNGEQYFVQTKYDGERSQIHMKDGKFKYFTRQGFDITNNSGYGETGSSGFLSSAFARLLSKDCKSIILDGELMGWHKENKEFGSKGMNYDVKKLTEKAAHQPCFVAFDIVMYNDVLLVDKPYEERLKILKEAFTEEEGRLIMGKTFKISTSEELREAFNKSMKDKEEGLVVKKCDVTYKPNVRDGSDCYKIKAEFSDDLVHDVDLIILGAYYGEGKFTGLMKSFMMGVASPPANEGENPTKFYSIVSVSNGLTMETLRELYARFEKLWTKDRPSNVVPPRLDQPDFWVRPEDSIILTLRATELTRSNDYPTGYSLRFPRVMRVRTDKPWYSVCTTTELKTLIKDAGPIQKLTKRQVTEDDIEKIRTIKVRRNGRLLLTSTKNEVITTNIHDDPPVRISRLFDGMEFYVINGNYKWSKEEIEKTLCQYGARVVLTPIGSNCRVIVGDVTTLRAITFLESRKYDVLSLDWLTRVIEKGDGGSAVEIMPWDLVACRKSTERRLAELYDPYYDSYTTEATEESLKRSLDKAGESIDALEPDFRKMRKLDEELFGGESPYSIFRGIVGYFDNVSMAKRHQFRFMSGTVMEDLDSSITHIFISGSNASLLFRHFVERQCPKATIIVRDDWISDCFHEQKQLPLTSYLVEPSIAS